MKDMAIHIGKFCESLSAKNIPHNMLIVDKGARVFVIPNAFSQRKAKNELPQDVLDSQVDPAVFEISGHQLMKRKEDYDGLTEEWVMNMLRCARFEDDIFDSIIQMACELYAK